MRDETISNDTRQLLDVFCERLGYCFNQSQLLQTALTHRSHSTPHNERLEFLGDAILNCVISGIIYKHFPELPEGHLSRLRANFVNQKALSSIALNLQMDKLLRLGEGELKSGGCHRPSILADTFEALLGAIYLDSDYAKVETVVMAIYLPLIQDIDLKSPAKDPKTLLQEFLQSQKLSLPEYLVVTTSGKAHKQKFKVECVISTLNIRTAGEGTNRRSAEQVAAKLAYEKICLQHTH
ncbi:ribonuclease III [Nitrosomonas ureae]|uniref:Ribonuclease 3 n=1 Tax=Nitrosomonas ureae TaxID=44577 RepID=A0A0S3AJ33_9PROT|nr:ribonuclease III [Nitrosomonas ureae]ALQ51170.1 ribonuclease 3 [Nitrosomonas ureae]SDU06347.1 RNAse III [Nitrosomonas ureae]SEQ41543.1 ribonuclease-3 [Nitrosomonas ureae]SOD15869.1 RNAse III [Nitrosomonas ureae]